MSYCVNCGVELHETCSVCPLCHTEVHNPRHPADENAPKPFPVRQGAVAPVQKADVLILISVVLAVTAGVCGLLNLLIFYGTYWSLYVIGGCVLLWVFCLPMFLPKIFISYPQDNRSSLFISGRKYSAIKQIFCPASLIRLSSQCMFGVSKQ